MRDPITQSLPRPTPTRWLAAIGLAASLLGAPVYANPVDAGQTAPDFTVITQHKPIQLSDYRGNVVLLDFWASWCGPCQASFPWMSSIQERYRDQGLIVIAVNLDQEKHLAEQFLHQHKVGFTVGFDPEGNIANAFELPGMPTSYLISSDGTVLKRHVGFKERHSQRYEDDIRNALANGRI